MPVLVRKACKLLLDPRQSRNDVLEADVVAIYFVAVPSLDQERRERRGEEPEEADAHEHQHYREPASSRRDRIRVAVPDRRHRGDRPPQTLREGRDVRTRSTMLEFR